MSEWTPAPWHWSGKDENAELVQTSHGTRDVWYIPRNEADMALICAAPDLYEALDLVRRDVQWQPDSPTLKIVEAALAKAKP